MNAKRTESNRLSPRYWFSSLEVKGIAALLASFALVLGSGAAGLSGLTYVSSTYEPIVSHDIPTIRATAEILSAINIASLAAEQALDIEERERLGEFTNQVARFNEARQHVEILIAALTWGSNTDAFKKSAGGRNARMWQELGYEARSEIQSPDATVAQQAAESSVYYQGFVNNAERAFAAREHYILAPPSEKTASARTISKTYMTQARYFASLAAENLSAIVQHSNKSASTSSLELSDTLKTVWWLVLLASFAAIGSAIVLGLFFVRHTVLSPVRQLVDAAEKFGKGMFSGRVNLKTGDEFQILGDAFNVMAERISKYTSNLEEQIAARTRELKNKVETLNKINAELDRSGKLLVRRDLELTRANERLRDLDQMKSDFVSIAIHQLRTPLSAVKWTLSVLLKGDAGPLSNEQRTLLMKTYESNDRMLSLLSDLVLTDQLDSQKLKALPQMRTILPDLLENLLLEIEPLAKRKNVHIEFINRKPVYPSLQIDPQNMRAVFQNLIENAIKYTKPGGSVKMEIKDDIPGKVIFSITDTGIGIPPENQKNVFTRFFRAKNAVRVEPNGSGLGLYIVKGIVEKHGGEVAFESSEDQGTTFRVVLPAFTTYTNGNPPTSFKVKSA